MSSHRILLASLVLGLGFSACATASDTDQRQAYPAAASGFQRHLIKLPAVADEDDHRVEFIAGKVMEVDCNLHRLGGEWEEKVAVGWGYRYYVLSQAGAPLSTMMACPDDSRHQAFVTVGGEAMLVRYNSKLPLVIYTPTDLELRYRIWSAGAELMAPPQD